MQVLATWNGQYWEETYQRTLGHALPRLFSISHSQTVSYPTGSVLRSEF